MFTFAIDVSQYVFIVRPFDRRDAFNGFALNISIKAYLPFSLACFPLMAHVVVDEIALKKNAARMLVLYTSNYAANVTNASLCLYNFVCISMTTLNVFYSNYWSN